MENIFTTADPADAKVSRHSLVVNLTSCPGDYRHHIQKSVDSFVDSISDRAGQTVDFSVWPWFWAFDMTFAIIFGRPLGFMESRRDLSGLVEAFMTTVRPAALLGQVPEWCPWTLGSKKIMALIGSFQAFHDPTQEHLRVGPKMPGTHIC